MRQFLDQPLLEGTAAEEFQGARERVVARHRHWRDNFGAVGLLLDTDEERARALAGNYATEAREVVGVWLSALGAEVNDAEQRAPRAAWVEGYWAAWREQVFASDDFARLEDGSAGRPGPRESFIQVFEELSGRYRDEAVAYVREGRPEAPSPSLLGRLLAPVRALGRGIGGFFFPGRSR